MKRGDSIRVIEGTGSPFAGEARGVAAAAICCGGKLYGEKPLVDYVEEKEPDKIVRSHRWLFDADTLLPFSPDFAAEEITVTELERRFNNLEWCAANPHHPIAHLRCFFDQIMIMEDKRKTWKPAILVRNGENYCLLGPDMKEEDRKEALAKLAES